MFGIDRKKIVIIGGTGDLGSGLARCWAAKGHAVVLGSRSADKARAAALQLAAEVAGEVTGAGNLEAAGAGDVVVVAVPFASHDAVLQEIKPAVAGKIVIDAVVPLVPPKVSVAQMPSEGSAAQIAQRILDGDARVVSAFHNIGASKLRQGEPLSCDTLVFGDDQEAKTIVMALADDLGSRGIDGGVLANSMAAEAMTSVLIGINRRYKIQGAGIRVTGLPAPLAS